MERKCSPLGEEKNGLFEVCATIVLSLGELGKKHCNTDKHKVGERLWAVLWVCRFTTSYLKVLRT